MATNTGLCPHCNQSNSYSATNCIDCGWALPWAAVAQRAQATAPPPVPQAQPRVPASNVPSPAQSPAAKTVSYFTAGLGGGLTAALGCCLAPFIILVFVSVLATMGQKVRDTSQPQPGSNGEAAAPTAPVARRGPSFFEADSRLDGRLTTWTKAQQQSYWQSISGTLVTWEGEVQEVEITSGGRILLRCNPKSYGIDTHVTLDGSQINKLSQISKSQRVTVQGILTEHNDYGYTITQAVVLNL